MDTSTWIPYILCCRLEWNVAQKMHGFQIELLTELIHMKFELSEEDFILQGLPDFI